MKLYLSQILILALLSPVLAHPSPSKTFKLIYSGGYVLTESLNAIISYEKNEFGLEFYLSSPSAAEKGQRVLVGITNSEDLRNGKLNFVIESMSGKQHSHHDPTTVSTTCHQSHQSPALRHLVRTCMGLAILRELSEDERNQIEAFKKASREETDKKFKMVYDAGQTVTMSVDLNKFLVQASGLTETMSIVTGDAFESASVALTGYHGKLFVVEGLEVTIEENDCKKIPPNGLTIQTCEGRLRVREVDGREGVVRSSICLGLGNLLLPPVRQNNGRLRLRPVLGRPVLRNQNNRRTRTNTNRNPNPNLRNPNPNPRNQNTRRSNNGRIPNGRIVQKRSKKAEKPNDDSIEGDRHEDGHNLHEENHQD